MSTRSSYERVLDILDAIDEIQLFVKDMDFEQFDNDRKTIRAIMTDFAIIGEAAGHIPKALTTQYPTVPWAVMRGMRNHIVHVYFSISSRILWDTIQDDLPTIVEPLRQLLAEIENT